MNNELGKSFVGARFSVSSRTRNLEISRTQIQLIIWVKWANQVQEIERVVHWPKSRLFDPRFPRSACRLLDARYMNTVHLPFNIFSVVPFKFQHKEFHNFQVLKTFPSRFSLSFASTQQTPPRTSCEKGLWANTDLSQLRRRRKKKKTKQPENWTVNLNW